MRRHTEGAERNANKDEKIACDDNQEKHQRNTYNAEKAVTQQ